MLADVLDEHLLLICALLPQLLDKISLARSSRRHAALLRPAINLVRERPREAAQRLGVSHLTESLDLVTDRVSDVGELVSFSAVLKSLNLYNNRIGPTGAAALADALKFNAVLNVLSLYANNIGDIGAAAFGECLREQRSAPLALDL